MIMRRIHRALQLVFVPLVLVAGAATAQGRAAMAQGRSACSNQVGTVSVPKRFCIEQVADSLPQLRHFAVAANGDLYAATAGRAGGLFVLHDTNHDGVYDARTSLYAKGGNDVVLRNATTLYYTTNDAVMRIHLAAGDKVLGVDTIVEGLPTTGNHTSKSIAFDKNGALYVDVGSATNTCQEVDRTFKSPGHDPCTELDTRGGVWQFDANKLHQTQGTAKRYATGLRNVVALTSHPVTGQLFGLQHGRDQLGDNWGYTAEQSAEVPSEIFVQINEKDDFGWPYCYHDRFLGKTVMAPEYGGDGKTVGRCASKKAPLVGFPGHWAPESIVFYNGTSFPGMYRGGAFIAFHGSWNRSPLPQAGFRVVFQPMKGSRAAGKYADFATGFADTKIGANGSLKPLGLAVGPDGSLYIGSDTGGKVWRVTTNKGR